LKEFFFYFFGGASMVKRVLFIIVLFLIIFAGTSCGGNPQNSAGQETAGQTTAGQTAAGMDISRQTDVTDPALKKLSSALLGLADEKYLPQGVTKEQLLKQMKDQEEISDFTEGNSNVTCVYVYIQITNGAGFADLNKHVVKTEVMDKDQSIAVCWVDINKLKETAALDYVTGIREVTPPETNDIG
jgi:hypothetical protein